MLDLYPSLPTPPKMKVMVEKFRAHGLNDPPAVAAHSDSTGLGGKWIRISPKKRGRTFSASHLNPDFKPSPAGIRIVEPVAEAPPLLNQDSQHSHGKGKEPLIVEEQTFAPPVLHTVPSYPAPRAAQTDSGEASSSRTLVTVVLPKLDPDLSLIHI